MNKIIFVILIAICTLGFTKKADIKHKLKSFELIKNSNFSGKPLEAIYFIKCKLSPSNDYRNFEVIKTNQKLKNFFMSEFVLCEVNAENQRLFYPFAWETSKIKEKDIETDCATIIEKKIKPVDVD